MKNLESLEAFDYGTNRREENSSYIFTRREVEQLASINMLEAEFNTIFDSVKEETALSRSAREQETIVRENTLHACGELLGRHLAFEAKREDLGKLDVQGEVRALVIYQEFLEHQILKRGPRFGHLIREPEFLSGINEVASFIHAERINEKARGAQSTVDYIHSIEGDPHIIFIGSEKNLDARHAIDLVIAKTNEPEAEEPVADEIAIVQVKTGIPSQEEIGLIKHKHREYATALKELQETGVGTLEHDKKIEKMFIKNPEVAMAKTNELQDFYNNLVKLNGNLEPTWESLQQNAEIYHTDPVLFYIRLRSINEHRLGLVHKQFKQIALRMVKEKVDQIVLPQQHAAVYNRLTRGPSHITSATKIISRIVAQGRVISEDVLTD